MRVGMMAALLTIGAACTSTMHRTPFDVLVEVNCLDEDGDGFPRDTCPADAPYETAGFPRDCNDFPGQDHNGRPAYGPQENPGLDEIPYDGLNNDCSGGTQGPRGDLIDVDGDGFPGISYDDYAALIDDMYDQVDVDDVWPLSLARDAVDCDDTDPGVHPGSGCP